MRWGDRLCLAASWWGRLLLLAQTWLWGLVGKEVGQAPCSQMPSQERRAMGPSSPSQLGVCTGRGVGLELTHQHCHCTGIRFTSLSPHRVETPSALCLLGHGAASLLCCHFFLFTDIASVGMVSPFISAFCYVLECSFSSHCNVSSFGSFSK